MIRIARGVVAVLGRLLLVTIFLMSALGNKIPKFNDVADLMAKVGVPEPRMMLAGAIVFLVVGAFSVLLGYKARFGAALLLVFLVLATYYFHAFWKESTPEGQQDQVIQFMKNLALMGAMLMIVANGAGAMSLDARTPRARPGSHARAD